MKSNRKYYSTRNICKAVADRRVSLIVLSMLLFQQILFAQNGAEYKAKYTEGVALLVTAGDYKIRFAERMSWTFRNITYKGKNITATSGAQQPVLNELKVPEGMDRFLGTGHRKEQIESMEIIVLDSKNKVIGTHEVKEGLNITEGESYIVHKRSKFYSEVGGLYYLHDAKITVSPAGIKQDYSFEVVADDYANVSFMYVFMHIFPKQTTHWLAGDDHGGTIEEGEFVADNSFTLKKDFRFCLVYNPEENLGVVLIYPKTYQGVGMKNAFWNRDRDNKHYLRIDPKRTKGDVFSYSALLKVYEAHDKDSFKTEGIRLAKEKISR